MATVDQVQLSVNDVRVTSNWAKFKLLMWKNWLLQKRSRAFFDMLIPVLFVSVLLYIRGTTDNTHQEAKTWPSISLNELPKGLYPGSFKGCPNKTAPDLTIPQCDAKWRIIYTPSNTITNKIMSSVEDFLDVMVYPYESEDKIETDLKVESIERQDTLGAVVFTNLDDEKIPDLVKYKIRMKDDHYWKTAGDDVSWETQRHYSQFLHLGPRYQEKGDYEPGYFYEGFLHLQRFVDLGIIFAKTGNSSELTDIDVQLQKYPFPSYLENPFIILTQGLLPLIIVLSFIVTFSTIVKEIVIEKELKLKETMMLMGLPPMLNWAAWFVKYLLLLTLTTILLSIFYKIPIGDSGAILSKSNAFIVFLLLELYATSLITSGFMLSTFFSKARNATGLSVVLFFLSYIPYPLMETSYGSMSLGLKLLSALLPNVAMSFGFRLIGISEASEGQLFTNIASPVTVDDNLTMLHIYVVLIFDAVLYFLLALYIEAVFPGEFGVLKPFYFPFTKDFWCPEREIIESSKNEAEHQNAMTGEFLESYMGDLKAGIRIFGLHKVFKDSKSGTKVAVYGTHLDMYQDQITVLLGHNGAGKSTTMLMLSGFFPPTSGTAIINGYDLNKDLKRVRQSLGLCPQHNVLFDHMTVKEHLTFFAKLKGSDDMNKVTDMIKQLGLEPKTDSFSKDLSGGMKRKLCCGIAFVGGTKVVILDEPTSGVDPESRRQMWDILQANRQGRTILLTTHFMDEADYLGDRIAIMAEGKIVCCGSSLFLKKKYGVGYHMIMVKTPECDTDRVTQIIASHVPKAKLESNVSGELTFLLPYESTSAFPVLFTELEERKEDLGITSFGASVTTMEEVFLKIGNQDDNQSVASVECEEESGQCDPNALPVFCQEYTKLTGCALMVQQFTAMFKKRVINSIRSPIVSLVQLIIPVFFSIIGCQVGEAELKKNEDTSALAINLDSYSDPVVLLETQDPKADLMNRLISPIENYIEDVHKSELKMTDNITEKIIDIGDAHIQEYSQRHITGLQIIGDYQGPLSNASVLVTGFFNGQPFHGPPHTVNIIGNILYKFATNNSAGGIEVTNHPLPRLVTDESTSSFEAQSNRAFQISFNMIFGMSFLMATFVLFLIKERTVRAKHLQFVSGVKASLFWLSVFAWDFINFMIPAFAIVVVFRMYNVDAFIVSNNWLISILIFIICACGVLPFVYVISFLFTVPASGLGYCVMLLVIFGQWLLIRVRILEQLGYGDTADLLRWIFYLFIPNYCFGDAFQLLNLNYQGKQICKKLIANLKVEFNYTLDGFCDISKLINSTFGCCKDNCGDACIEYHEDYLSVKQNGIGAPLIFMSFHFFFYFGIIMFFESEFATRLRQKVSMSAVMDEVTLVVEDSDVVDERLYIESQGIDELKKQHPVVVRGMRKLYGSFVAVSSSNFYIKSGDCFGLLGVNGAGKTTTFQMLTGDVVLSAGDAYLKGFSVTSDINSVRRNVGYCPQFDALIDIMTVKETLNMYAQLRGIPSADIPKIVKNIMANLQFSSYANVKTGKLSGGNKRKVSIGIALIGSPYIIFLDEPTTGMDPVARRLIWNTLTQIRDMGRTLVLTSHSMDECEALCTKIVIMVNGKLQCLGTPQHLKSKFAEGYQMTIKVRSDADEPTINERSQKFMAFVQSSLPGAELKDYHIGYMTYITPSDGLEWADIFRLIEENKEKYEIEDYSISQTTLEQVFLTLARSQKPPFYDIEKICCTCPCCTCGFRGVLKFTG